MKTYRIYLKQTDNGRIEDLILVRDGFSFWAFVFDFMWFFVKKAWLLGLGVLGVFVLLAVWQRVSGIGIYTLTCIKFGMSLFIGFEANDWYAAYLQKRKGFKFIGHSFGNDETEAKLKFLDRINEQNKKSTDDIKVFEF